MSEILFVTSFDWSLFKASGQELVRTFRQHQKSGRLLLCYEAEETEVIERIRKDVDGLRVLGYDLTYDPYVAKWDRKWRRRCQQESAYWNRRAWQWYRKSVCMRFAIRYLDDFDWLIWLDCDCEFTGSVENLEHLIQTGRNQPCVFFFNGIREWTETGVMVYDLRSPRAVRFVEEFIRIYDSGEFAELDRWDDCWVFDETKRRLEEDRDFHKDLAKEGTKLRVLESSVLGRYLTHKKGSHLKKGVR